MRLTKNILQNHYVMNKNSGIIKEVKNIVRREGGRNVKLEAVCRLLDREVGVFDWTGFYLAAPDEENTLILGPYVGEETDHVRIPFGSGICGQAAETLDTFVVQDVSKEENYLACSIHVKSEIVVPIMKGDLFVGELDIDSHTRDAITPELQELCEQVCRELSVLF